MRDGQTKLLLQINTLVTEIRDATTTETFLALLDVALDHELDLASDIAFYGPADYPMITRLVLCPGTQDAGLRIQLSPAVVIVSGPPRTADGRRDAA
jgi:hypothetical protein